MQGRAANIRFVLGQGTGRGYLLNRSTRVKERTKVAKGPVGVGQRPGFSKVCTSPKATSGWGST